MELSEFPPSPSYYGRSFPNKLSPGLSPSFAMVSLQKSTFSRRALSAIQSVDDDPDSKSYIPFEEGRDTQKSPGFYAIPAQRLQVQVEVDVDVEGDDGDQSIWEPDTDSYGETK